MLVLPVEYERGAEEALKIQHVDYDGQFSADEYNERYTIGKGNCGEAWRLGFLRPWASDLPEPERVDMTGVASQAAKSCQSVLSSPIRCRGKCIGVLNLDSTEDSKSTHIQLQLVQRLLAEAAREIVPILFPTQLNQAGAGGG
jgi:hypothetical protein